MAQALGHFINKEVTQRMADKKSESKKSSDKVATNEHGGPINPVRDANPDYANAEGTPERFPWEADPTADADDSSASVLLAVNEAREAGEPLNQKDDSRPVDAQGATDPAGTGVSAP